jgi:regulator of sigma E protease
VVLGVDPVESIAFPVELLNRTVKAGPIRSFELGAKRTIVVSKQIFLTLRSLFRRDVSAKNLAGPVGIAHTFTVVIERGRFSMFIYLLALISINLGLFNLLPFPILDGGHLLFLAIEKIKGSPVDIRVQEWATNIAFFLIMALAVFVTFNDVKRIFH